MTNILNRKRNCSLTQPTKHVYNYCFIGTLLISLIIKKIIKRFHEYVNTGQIQNFTFYLFNLIVSLTLFIEFCPQATRTYSTVLSFANMC